MAGMVVVGAAVGIASRSAVAQAFDVSRQGARSAVVQISAHQPVRAESRLAPSAQATRSVWDGVYTEDQAKRGEGQYSRNCEACHGADLSGNPVQEVPSLVYDAFLTQWSKRTVKDLFETVKRSMPRDNPGGLNARAYVDVIAYVLQANKIPTGSKELSLNPDALAEIVIEREKP
jgi:cytochrome c5